MSFSEKESGEDVEALVDTLTIDANTLAENSISLSTSDLQQLAELSQELHLSTEMEAEGEVIIDSQGENMEIEEEIVETELGAEDIEIESEQPPSPEEILPDTKKTPSTTSVPPLRPLTIAPKPTKVPITIKPVAGSQQLLLVQGPNQTIKLLSPQGQELNVANVSLGRPLTIKPTVKTITNQGVPQKQILMKKMATSGQKITTKPLTAIANKQGQIMVVQKADPPQVKLVQSSTPLTQITSPTKTITLQQAQEMGLLTSAKLMPQAHSTPKQTVLLNKGQAKTIKLVPQMTPTQMVTSLGGNMKTISVTQAKQPTKILPANKLPQHIIFKKGTNTQTILPSAQLIQVAGNQALGATQLHQINIPGKGDNGKNKISYWCDICDKELATATSFSVHQKSHSTEKPYECCYCNAAFTRKPYLEAHLRSHTGERPFECNICNKFFSQKSSLNTHLKCHGDHKPYVCHSCGKCFPVRSYLISHEWTHFDNKNAVCQDCKRSFSSKRDYMLHLKTHSFKKFICRFCHKAFSKETYLIRHENNAHEEDGRKKSSYWCDICNKVLASATSYYVHKKSHSDEKPYKCCYCNAAFSRKPYLEVHLRTHTGERPFKCKICDKTFTQKSSLNTHLKSHSGLKPYICSSCGKGFAVRNYLVSHEWTHLAKEAVCQDCQMSFSNKKDFILHMETHSLKKYICGFCHKPFSKETYLIRHENKVHKEFTSI